jgi:type IV secretory pathway TraG/TraD family ATPase VirD4
MGTHRAEHVGNEPDPYGSIQQHRRLPSLLHTMHVGMTADQWVITDPETSMLVIAPPRSPGGKTRSVAVANTIMAAGPTVVSSTKTDIARNTAVAARRKGTLWEFNALEPTMAGFTELRFSPVNLVTDKASALRVATDLMSVGDPESSSRGMGDATHRFFRLL